MEKRIISIDVHPENQNEYTENAGVMWEHNATELQFNLDAAYIGDYRYYIEYRSIMGTKVRTDYLDLNETDGNVNYLIPVDMSSLKAVEGYFNIVQIDEDGNTAQVIKAKKFCLTFDFSPDTDNSLAKVNEFSINTLLEAIRTGTFKGDKGDRGEKGETGTKGDQGDGVNNLFASSVNLYNESTNTLNTNIDASTGNLKHSDNYQTTDFIFLKAGQYVVTYTTTAYFGVIAKYTMDKKYISGTRKDFTNGNFEVAEDCYVRFSGLKTKTPKNTIMLVEGTELPTEYVPYSVKLKSEHMPEFTKDMLVDELISKEKTDFIKTNGNLINQMTIEKGKVINGTTGVMTDSAQNHISDKLYLKKATKYTGRKLTRVVFFDRDNNFIKSESVENTSYLPKTFTTPDEFLYAIAVLPDNSIVKDEWQLYEGTTVPEKYEKQYLIIDGYRLYDEPDIEVDPITEFRNKDRVVFDKAPLFTLDNDVDGINASQKNSASIFKMYDDLMSENPLYITRTALGTDSQGNMLYRYDFKSPEMHHGGTMATSTSKPKVILVSGIHGSEYTGIFSLFNAMKQITTNPELENLKNDVHFIIVPIINIYGVNHNTRYNENRINMGRNFKVGFEANTGSATLGFSGEYALSENGCRYVYDILEANQDAILFSSCHNFAGTVDDEPKSFLWASCQTKYFSNLAEKHIIKLSQEWGKKYDNLPTKNGYVLNNIASPYVGYTEMANLLGTESNQALGFGIQSGIIEMCDRFWFEGDTPATETSFVVSRGAESCINLILINVYNYDSNF